MSFTLKDVAALDSFKKSSLLTTNCNLDREVNWIYLAETSPNLEKNFFKKNTEVLFFCVGHGASHNFFTLKDLVDDVYELKAAGLVFFLGRYIYEIPDEIIAYCESLNLPVFTLPWEVSYIDVNKELTEQLIKRSLIEKGTQDLIYKILFEDDGDRNALVKMAQDNHINLKTSYFAYIISIDNYEILTSSIPEEIFDDIKSKLYNLVKSNSELGHYSDMDIQNEDQIILIIKDVDKNKFIEINQGDNNILKKLTRQINDYIKNKKYYMKPISLTIGIGNSTTDILSIKNSYLEGEKVISARRRQLLVGKCICYDDLGVYKLLFMIENSEIINSAYPDKLKKILEYDNANDSTLIPTLEKYLENQGSLIMTAEAMNIHKNTVTYRINKIKSLLDLDITKPKNIPIILMEIKAIRFMTSDHNR